MTYIKINVKSLKFRGAFLHSIRYIGFPGGLVVKNLPANAGDVCLVPGLGRSPRVGHGDLLFLPGKSHYGIFSGCRVWALEPTGFSSFSFQVLEA